MKKQSKPGIFNLPGLFLWNQIVSVTLLLRSCLLIVKG